MLNKINIWQTQSHNYVNGHGCRFVIWVQGCHLACPECWSKHTWSFYKQRWLEVDKVFDEIVDTKNIEGVTFSGGEPFVQAKSLYYLAKRIKDELGLNLQIFTGYELTELTNKYQTLLLELADVIVSGRFDNSKFNNNQKVHNLQNIKWNFNNTDVEVEVDNKGNVVITGYPTNQLVNDIRGLVQ